MGKIVNSTFVSLDGVINHMERWHFDYVDAETDALALEQLRASDALLMGRHTYEAYAGVWPGLDSEVADRINAMTKYVASTTLQSVEWENTTILDGDLIEAVTKLKEDPGRDILMHGYGPVAQSLVRHGLLDELVLWVHPELAGIGTADDVVLTQDLAAHLALLDARPLASGVVVLHYQLT